MITHGKKQISEIWYARKASEGGGAVRLTNIIRGAQVVFGGTVGMWLKYATRAAILAAFGQTDGKAVIKATNAYLNGIAATDPNKASALAGFINEDPMLVCSLGLQPQGVEMPIRWLVGDGNSYFLLDAKAINPTYAKVLMRLVSNANQSPCCARIGDNRQYIAFIDSGRWCWPYGTNYSYTTTPSINTNYLVEASLTESGVLYKINDTVVFTGNSVSSADIKFALFARHQNGSIDSVCPKGTQIAYADFDSKGKYLPLIRNEQMELIDIVSGNLAERHGSFTIEYTLPDGTPWTPLNQTP